MIIYKFPLFLSLTQIVYMSQGAQILSVGEQKGELKLWAKVDTKKPTARRRINIVGTGFEAPEDGKFLGTVQVNEYVWHVFDMGEG